MSSGYEQLLELTRTQQALVAAGRWEEAVVVGDAWQRLVDTLPEQAPPEARLLLEQAEAIAWTNTAAVEAAAAAIASELEHIGRGRRAIASYAVVGQAPTR